MIKKICVVTGSRAEYGLLKKLIRSIHAAPEYELVLVVTGSHLSEKFGKTVREIEEDGFPISREIPILYKNDDSSLGVAHAMGECLVGCANVFEEIRPDLVILLGDRYEIFSAAAAATSLNLTIAHIHGGEITSGALDDAFRHAITKMSHIHFVGNETYRRRVIQLGEEPSNVHNVGGLGVDAIENTKLIPKKELEIALNLKFGERNLIVTFHPETIEHGESNLEQLFEALDMFPEICLIFTLPNADQSSDLITTKIHEFVKKRKNAHAFTSLGSIKFLSCLAIADGMIGNSSSGLAEAPTLRKGTINIGNRQLGRMQSSSVLNCNLEKFAIKESIEALYSVGFQEKLLHTVSPYGRAGASEKIFEILKKYSFEKLKLKKFLDLDTSNI
jgi:GDP/UDP-N,N'-diacetylbacillosamine 2-epimerase (hydrolysing)